MAVLRGRGQRRKKRRGYRRGGPQRRFLAEKYVQRAFLYVKFRDIRGGKAV
jgi:hypothetical protein